MVFDGTSNREIIDNVLQMLSNLLTIELQVTR